ncbi:MAG: hypothetical protein Tsb0021_09440 [Chlamydiales bacterium]
MVKQGKEKNERFDKEERRFEHIESQSQDFGRYPRNPKEVPPKHITPTQSKQTHEELMQEEIERVEDELEGETRRTVKDPVCGKILNPETATFSTTYEDEEYAFCCQKCLISFEDSPEDYLP